MSRSLRAVAPIILAIAAVLQGGCGSDLPPSSQVTVRITPATPTARVGGTVTLVGDATGFTRSPIVRWWISELHSGNNDDCGYLTLPPVSPCPFGYVVFGSVTQFPSSATYYAPASPGTYHVTLEATQNSEFDYLTKTAEATITVTP